MAASFVSIKVDGVTSTAPSPIELIAANQATLLAYLNGLGYGTFTVIINTSQTLIALYQNEHKIEEIVTSNPSYTWTINPTNCHTINVDPDEYCDYLLSQPGAGSGLVDYITAIVVDGNRYETPDPNGIAATDTAAVQSFLNDNGLSYISYSNNGSYYVIAALTNHVIHYIEIRRFDTNSNTEITTVLHFVQSDCHVPVLGCTNMQADNYNPNAEIDDGTCAFNTAVRGCTDPNAINYNRNATINDGTCRYLPVLEEDKLGCCSGQMAYKIAVKRKVGETVDCCDYLKLEAVQGALDLFRTYIKPGTIVRYEPEEETVIDTAPANGAHLDMPVWEFDCNGLPGYGSGITININIGATNVSFSIAPPGTAVNMAALIVANGAIGVANATPFVMTDVGGGIIQITPDTYNNTYIAGTYGSGAFFNGYAISMEALIQYTATQCDWAAAGSFGDDTEGVLKQVTINGGPATPVAPTLITDTAAMEALLSALLSTTVVWTYDIGTHAYSFIAYMLNSYTQIDLLFGFPVSGSADVTVNAASQNCDGEYQGNLDVVTADGEYEVIATADCIYGIIANYGVGAVITGIVIDGVLNSTPDDYDPTNPTHQQLFLGFVNALNLGTLEITDWATLEGTMTSDGQPMGIIIEEGNHEYFIAFERTQCTIINIVQNPIIHQDGEGCDITLTEHNDIISAALTLCEGCCHTDEEYVKDNIR